ncbi:alpha/beta hydrolase family protein [Sphingomonas sp. MMS24-J13]|uniref:alpha/beta hydrolase family protein n=1 Tax=Sphingomonas sp. MMS24-J13 TaxID=3238686 RepID=UPI00384B6C20
MGCGSRAGLAALLALSSLAAKAQTQPDIATAFGARESVLSISLSPDGTKLAMVVPGPGDMSILAVRGVADDSPMKPIMRSDGKHARLGGCHWASNVRIVCSAYGVTEVEFRKVPYSRLFAVDDDGKNVVQLSTREGFFSLGLQLGGGSVIDWLPDESGAVLMARNYLPDRHTGSVIGTETEGVGVDRVDTGTLASKNIEAPKRDIAEYISDGRGTVRIQGLQGVAGATYQMSGVIHYSYRRPGTRAWEPLGDYNWQTQEGFNPEAIDHDLNLVYGFKKKDGRQALYAIALDGSRREALLFARPDVDVSGLVRIGRRNRAVGVSYETDMQHVVYFDPVLKQLAASLAKAIPSQPDIRFLNSSVDEHKLLIFAGSDTDPGVYYLFDRDKHDLHILALARNPLADRKLATMAPIRYKAGDGADIPAYLTLPPGKESAKGLPAIVMPHGGPAARDSWGFDWLVQYYAAAGYAVLQPEFRGSYGYGDGWYRKNGFQSWRTAVGDVVDAGRWLVSSGIADPHKLAIVGWSYGGYAALQSAVIAPDLFKAVVAIAPVTDLAMLKEESRNWSDNAITSDFIGNGTHIREGSPLQNVDKIKAPVLLAHGTKDANVAYQELVSMEARLKSAGDKVRLISFDGLDHQLDNSAARALLLRESDTFIREATGQ